MKTIKDAGVFENNELVTYCLDRDSPSYRVDEKLT